MSGFGVGEEAGESAVAGYGEAVAVDVVDVVGDAEPAADAAEDREPVEEYPDADPQQWISGLIAALERAEQGIGSGPRDALMARIKLAQAYSELGDTAQAAPLAVANVAQAEQLFPSSEGMLRQLREFRDAACEAAGWTAAMMREPEGVPVAIEEGPSELVARPEASEPEPQPAPEPEGVAQAEVRPWPEAEAVAEAWPAVGPTAGEEAILGHGATPEAEPEGAVIHEFIRRIPGPEPASWEPQATTQPAQPAPPAQPIHPAQPAELAIPTPPEPEYAEEVAPTVPAADLAAFEEIVRLRYELREAQRTIERLKHVNRKLREALEYEAE